MESTAVVDAVAGVGLQGRPAVAAGQPVLSPSERAGLPRDGSPDAGDADPLRREYDECLTSLTEIAREEAELAARKVRMVARCAQVARAMTAPEPSVQEQAAQEMALVAEVACALTIREHAAAGLLVEARELMSALPLTLSALEAGSISWQHARIMVDETSSLGPEGARALEAHFLDPDAPRPVRACLAGELVAGRFRARARAWRERHHPVSIEKRHAKCVADRRVLFSPDRDGMAWFSAYLPADTASGIWERTTAAARAMQGPDEGRTLTQLRADKAATWLLGGCCAGESDDVAVGGGSAGEPNDVAVGGGCAGESDDVAVGGGCADAVGGSTGGTGAALVAGSEHQGPRGVPVPRAQVLITVPVMALLGKTEEPAMLDGYGPVPPSMARRLVADGAESFHRVLIDPRDGAPLEIGRSSYRVTRAQRQWLRLRDGRCPFPGCGNQSLDNEADHVLAWAEGGATGISNLGQPCRRHHRLRHTTGWTPTKPGKNEPPGWISPAGRHYNSEHPDWEPPHWPAEPGTTDGLGDDSLPSTGNAAGQDG
jgi:hypothetical protein